MKYISFFILIILAGCMSAKISGTGVNVHDPMHGFEVQANSVNAEVSVNAAR